MTEILGPDVMPVEKCMCRKNQTAPEPDCPPGKCPDNPTAVVYSAIGRISPLYRESPEYLSERRRLMLERLSFRLNETVQEMRESTGTMPSPVRRKVLTFATRLEVIAHLLADDEMLA